MFALDIAYMHLKKKIKKCFSINASCEYLGWSFVVSANKHASCGHPFAASTTYRTALYADYLVWLVQTTTAITGFGSEKGLNLRMGQGGVGGEGMEGALMQ